MKKILIILSVIIICLPAILGNANGGSKEKSTETLANSTTNTEPVVKKDDSSKRTCGNEDPLLYPGEEKHLRNMRQLTFEGENAEAYFNSDGTELILQRHVESDECDQIFIMDLETGKMNMVSTGKGVTTCAYFGYPDNEKIIYCSTHLKQDECPPKVNRMKGYIWRLYPEFDVFLANPDGSDLVQLTDAWGYDAEAAFAHDGSRIVWTSMASGDLDIWTMNPDGSDKKQLTDGYGYDGGPFFSWDSSKIVWRCYYPDTPEEIEKYRKGLEDDSIRPMPLQIWYMNADGSGKKQVTNNGAANFCPFFQPGDNKIIYTSNYKAAFPMDFNLWISDLDGTYAEQVTFYNSFDAFPMFSPDGEKLVFGSNRNQAKMGDTNVFICDWVD